MIKLKLVIIEEFDQTEFITKTAFSTDQSIANSAQELSPTQSCHVWSIKVL